MIEDENLGRRRAFGAGIVGDHGGMRRCGPVGRGERERRRGFRTRDRVRGLVEGIGACPPQLYKAPNPPWLSISEARTVPTASRVRFYFSSHAFLSVQSGKSHDFVRFLILTRILRGVNELHRTHLGEGFLRYTEQRNPPRSPGTRCYNSCSQVVGGVRARP